MISSFEGGAGAADLQAQFVAALRAELEECGGLAALLEAQRGAILDRSAMRALALGEKIERQMQNAMLRSQQRESLMKIIAEKSGRDEGPTLRELPALFPASMRPMVRALVDEVHRLIGHTLQQARQNQMLLTRAMGITAEVQEAAVAAFRPTVPR